MATFYVHHNGAAWFVKEGDFFVQQGGLTSDWGKNWTEITAESIEDARARAAEKWPEKTPKRWWE